MNAYAKEYTDDEYEDFLNEIYEPVLVCGMTFDAGRILRELDPITFRCGKADLELMWVCDECGEEFDSFDEADECCNDEEVD